MKKLYVLVSSALLMLGQLNAQDGIDDSHSFFTNFSILIERSQSGERFYRAITKGKTQDFPINEDAGKAYQKAIEWVYGQQDVNIEESYVS